MTQIYFSHPDMRDAVARFIDGPHPLVFDGLDLDKPVGRAREIVERDGKLYVEVDFAERAPEDPTSFGIAVGYVRGENDDYKILALGITGVPATQAEG